MLKAIAGGVLLREGRIRGDGAAMGETQTGRALHSFVPR